jgi:hypothetical protein
MGAARTLALTATKVVIRPFHQANPSLPNCPAGIQAASKKTGIFWNPIYPFIGSAKSE